jgi:hypothetical protein
MPVEKPYIRKISSEEARESYILVLKSRLRSFPPVGEAFVMARGTHRKRAKVESVPCICRGPEQPHEHYFVRWKGLKRGERVAIRRLAGGSPRYRLTAVE